MEWVIKGGVPGWVCVCGKWNYRHDRRCPFCGAKRP